MVNHELHFTGNTHHYTAPHKRHFERGMSQVTRLSIIKLLSTTQFLHCQREMLHEALYMHLQQASHGHALPCDDEVIGKHTSVDCLLRPSTRLLLCWDDMHCVYLFCDQSGGRIVAIKVVSKL